MKLSVRWSIFEWSSKVLFIPTCNCPVHCQSASGGIIISSGHRYTKTLQSLHELDHLNWMIIEYNSLIQSIFATAPSEHLNMQHRDGWPPSHHPLTDCFSNSKQSPQELNDCHTGFLHFFKILCIICSVLSVFLLLHVHATKNLYKCALFVLLWLRHWFRAANTKQKYKTNPWGRCKCCWSSKIGLFRETGRLSHCSSTKSHRHWMKAYIF